MQTTGLAIVSVCESQSAKKETLMPNCIAPGLANEAHENCVAAGESILAAIEALTSLQKRPDTSPGMQAVIDDSESELLSAIVAVTRARLSLQVEG